MKKYVEDRPKKIERVNKVVGILNTTNDVTEFKRAENELVRLIMWKDHQLMHVEDEFNPDLLKV